MITKKKFKSLLAVLSFAVLLFPACNNDNENDVTFSEQEQLAFEGEESAESMFDIIESITSSALEHADINSGGRYAVSHHPEIACAMITLQQGELAKWVTIDFGNGCDGPDGKTRKGKIKVEYTGGWLTKGAVITTIAENFYVNDLKIAGTRVVTSQGIKDAALSLSVKIVGGKIIWPDGSFLTRESVRTHKIMLSEDLSAIELQVTGGASGVTREGIEYAAEIIEPLVFTTSCSNSAIYLPVSGMKTITVPELPVFTINYGEGACDNKFTVITDRGSKEITL